MNIPFLVLVLCLILIVTTITFVIRDRWISKNRLKILNEDRNEYKKLLSYEYMLFHFWIWDIEKFKSQISNEFVRDSDEFMIDAETENSHSPVNHKSLTENTKRMKEYRTEDTESAGYWLDKDREEYEDITKEKHSKKY